jgi:MarR-like DNA-binding transcriptional regulator SgrR of sgrS sRNA
MQNILHYLELRSFLNHQAVGVPQPITVEKLTEIWQCSPRYVKLIVRRLSESGFIGWQSGLGRGHSSQLTLIADSDEVLLGEVKSRVEKGRLQDALDLLTRFGGDSVKQQFMEWLSQDIGFSTMTVSDRPQETLRFPVYRSIQTLDPGKVYYAFDCHIAAQLFNTLVEFHPESESIRPCLAHSWDMRADAKEWTFHLRKSIRFHHGRELTASDVLFSLNRVRQHPDEFESGWMFEEIERLEAVDYKTVNILLKEPNYLFLRFLCSISAAIVPEELVRKSERDFAANPVGTGPFRLSRFYGGICTLEAFLLHFRGRPHLDRVEIMLLPDLEPGCLKEPDWASVRSSDGYTSEERLEDASSNKDEWCDLEAQVTCCSMLVFNRQKDGPQNHPEFRRALYNILEPQQMIADLGHNLIYPGAGFRPHLPPLDAAISPALSRFEIIEMLQASGYAGEAFILQTNSFHEAEAAWIQERCRSFGVSLEFHVNNDSSLDSSACVLPDARLFGFVLNQDEVSEMEVYAQPNYFLPAFDEPLAVTVKNDLRAILREPEKMERQHRLEMLECIIRQSHAVLFLTHNKNHTSFHKFVQGINMNNYGWPDYHKIWFPPRS